MIFNAKSLNLTDKFVSDISIDEIIKREIKNYNLNPVYLKKIFDLNKELFIYFLDKYGGYIFYSLEETLYKKLILGTYDLCMFSEKIRKEFDEVQLRVFLSCFFIEKDEIEYFADSVEKDILFLEDDLSFNEFKTAYTYELKNLIDNFKILKK